MLVYGRNVQYFRPRLKNESTSVKNIVSVGIDMCLVIYADSSLAVFKLPCLELLDTTSANWMTNSDEFGEVDISCVHVDEYTEKNLKTFVYIGTDLGDVHVLDISPKGSIKICDYTISCRDVELACQMRVTAILSVYSHCIYSLCYVPALVFKPFFQLYELNCISVSILYYSNSFDS